MGSKDDLLAAAFGVRLRELRTAAGLTQADLAARVNPPMQLQAIARYEAGSRGPTLSIVYRLASALGVPPEKLLPEGSQPSPPAKKKGKPK